ncbi:replication factor C subunit 1-like [Ylistrum balloti]|uniref:replication factor C subunit 1-like n=1 Tax=Ylistrum balloti TaxID=509963 RepID=UPI002905DE00|nr:replication factor C subunit 1-like [Ylistrum balloti]
MDIRSFFSCSNVKKTNSSNKTEKPENPKLNVKGKSVKSSKKDQNEKNGKDECKSTEKGKDNDKKGKSSDIKGSKDSGSKAKKVIILDSDEEDVNGNLSGKKYEKQETKESSKKRKRQASSEEGKKDTISGHKKSGKKAQIIESDSDEEPIPRKSARSQNDKKKAGIVFMEDSDEEPVKKSSLDSFLKTPSPQKVKSKTEIKKSETKTPVNVSDFFGSKTVQRSDRKTVVSKRKLDEDEEVHDDDDFEKTLAQLDNVQPSKKPRVSSSTSPHKSASPSGNLSSKLAAKAKEHSKATAVKKVKEEAKTLVPETPESKQFSKKASPEKLSPKKLTSPKKDVSPKKISPFKSEKADTPKVSPGKPGTTSPPKSGSAKTSPDVPELASKTSYRSYLTREGPRSLGAKEIPEGAENCLEGLTFVLTGVSESFERDDLKQMVEKYGGKVTGSVSKKTNYLVAGRDSGESKLQKARGFGTIILDEDGFLNLIKTKPGKKSKYEIQAEKETAKEKSKTPLQKAKSVSKLAEFERRASTSSPSVSSPEKKKEERKTDEPVLMWVDKYKPVGLKQLIAQQGDKSNAKKLLHWLTNWHKNEAAGTKPQGKFFGKDDGAGMKAALLSGPPGIGKTTTATLVCKEAGFSFVELNASDTRSKKSLQHDVAEALGNETLVDYMGPGRSKSRGQKHCLLMDEVDGMAGNEDRGGLQELVSLIKGSRIPVICMCNDRNHQKMRTLSNYCFDLRFQRPRVEQIKAAMMSIAFKEGLKIPPPALNEIILAANHDVRQVIHNMSMWTAGNKSLTYEQAKEDSSRARKDMKMGPFDVCRKVFVGGEETANMTLIDKSDLFFHDYSFGPLFVQENYINVVPYAARGNAAKHLSLLARTAHSISDGDLVDKAIRSRMAWNLLPTQAMYSSVIPGEFMRGSFPQMVSFPTWLGQNSSRGKTDRILQETRTHMRLRISGDKRSLNMDYLPYMRHSLTLPLVTRESEGVPEVISLMEEYDIIKEDYDNILEISKWPNSDDPLKHLSTKTKSAFTRTYNKGVHLTPYSTGVLTKKKRGGVGSGGALAGPDGDDEEGNGAMLEESEDDENDDKDDLQKDTMIKQTKKKPAASKEKTQEPSTKGKGKGKTSKKRS